MSFSRETGRKMFKIFTFFVGRSVYEVWWLIRNVCVLFMLTLFRTAVAFWGQSTLNLSGLSPKRD